MNKYALLSIVPGLGQLCVGDKRKGILFLEVALINYLLLTIVCFSQSIAHALWQIGEQYNVKPNYEMISALNGMHLGSPASFLLIFAMLVFWRYATCDAIAKAQGKRRKAIYRDSALDFSEATSSSYVGHVALMISCMLLAIMFVQAPKRPAQIVDIQFMEEQVAPKPITPPKTHLVSTKDVQSHSRRMHDTPRVAHQSSAAPSKPVPEAKPPAPVAPPAVPQPVAAMRAPAPAPAPAHASAPAPSPSHAVNAMAPTPHPATAVSAFVPAPPTPINAPAAAMAPTPHSHLPMGVPAAPTLPMLSRPTGGNISTMPTAVSGINTAGFSHFAPVPTAFRSSSIGPAAAMPTTISTHGTGSGSAPDVVALVPHSSAGLFNGGGNSVGSVSPIRAPHTGTGTGGPAIAVAPAVPRSGGGGTSGAKGDSQPSIPDGDGGMRGDTIATKAGNPDFTEYMAELQRRIKRHWFPPKDGESRKITVQFKVGLDGTMSQLHITKSAGVSLCDQAALSAIQTAAPFQHLPKNSPESVDIEFTFDYNVFNGTGSGGVRRW